MMVLCIWIRTWYRIQDISEITNRQFEKNTKATRRNKVSKFLLKK